MTMSNKYMVDVELQLRNMLITVKTVTNVCGDSCMSIVR